MNDKKRGERIVAEDVAKTVWLRLRRLTSKNLCRGVIRSRAPSLAAEILDRKAEGVASAVRSALGYWQQDAASLNAKILSRYYAVLQMSIAEQVASNDVTADLEDIQRHTEAGHGLATMMTQDGSFPANYKIACLKGGHFYAYSRYRDISLADHAFDRRPREWNKLSDAERGKLVSLADLFRRVPELQPIVRECLDAPPLSFQVGHASRNMALASERTKAQIDKTGRFQLFAPPEGPTTITYAAIYSHDPGVTAEYLESLGLPFCNIQLEEDRPTRTSHFVGELSHPTSDLWWDHFESYKSGYCGTSVIAPFWGGIRDPFVIHLIILYACSIIVRYLPSLWHRIEDGDLDHVRALFEYYLSIVDNVLPAIAMERVTGTRTFIVQPGSFNAPI